VLTKRPCTERPPGARSSGRVVKPRRSTDVPVIKKSTGSKKIPPKPDEPEMIRDGNFGDMNAELWREFHLRDPYRFKKRTYTGGGKLFWTFGQKQMWDDHYNEKGNFKEGWDVHQHVLHMTHFNNHIPNDFHFIDECLRKLGVLEIASFK
jgi:hypothetical protein